MTLLYVAAAYLAGVAVAAILLPWLPAQCGVPGWLWLIPAALLSFAPLTNRLIPAPDLPLRWGREFGFRAPRPILTPALVAACALAMLAGMLRFWGDPLYPCFTDRDLATYNVPAEESFNVEEGWRVIEGDIVSYVAQGTDTQRITVSAQRLQQHGVTHEVKGRVTLLVDPQMGLRYGDAVQVAGVLSTPPEFADFSWRDWLARRRIYSTMNLVQVTPLTGAPQGNPLLQTIYALRSRGEAVLNDLLPEPHAALANGMLLGIDANISDALMQEFNDTSASHVIVISGSNIALIAGVLMAVGSRFGKSNRWVVAATLAGIGIYAVLVGAEASVVRAAIMGGLLVIATALNRRSTAIVSLAAAALAMTLANPHILWDVGFQLSAVATLGLILLVPALRPSHASQGEETASAVNPLRSARALVVDTIVVSMAAMLAVTPLLIWHFQRLSVIGLLTNLLIVPIQPLILVSGLGGLITGIVGLLPVARLLLAPAWLGLVWTIGVVERSAQVRWASLAVGGPATAVLCAICLVVGVLVWQQRPRRTKLARNERPAPPAASATPTAGEWQARWQERAVSSWMSGALVILAALAWLGVAARPDGKVHLWFLPAERGQAVLIQSPSGRQVLVDGGDDSARLLSTLGGVMGFWDRSLDSLLLTVADERTVETQAALARRLRVDTALTTLPLEEEVATWARLLDAVGVQATSVLPYSSVQIADGVSVSLLVQRSASDAPGVVEVRYGNLRVLLPGATGIDPLLLAGEAAAVSVPDLGRTSIEVMLQQNAAEHVIIYGDETLAGAHYPNIAGVVHLWSDGTSLWLAPQ